MMIKISSNTLRRIIEDVMRETLPLRQVSETAPLPPSELKRREKERAEDTKERQRDTEREMKRIKKVKQSTNPMEDVMNTFRTFANGIMEEDEDSIDDEGSNDILIDMPDDDDELDEKKKKKPNCGGLSGTSTFHDSDGEFSGKKDASTFSIKKYKGADCRHGTTRVKGNNDSIATKLPCGAKGSTSKGGTGQHRKRCKDGSDKW